MGKMGRKREIRSPLQAVFLKRVEEEMRRQGISRNQLAQRIGAPPQTTLNDVMLGADPRLETVHGVAVALGVPVVSLLTETTTSQGTIHSIATYPKISEKSGNNNGHKVRDKKRTNR